MHREIIDLCLTCRSCSAYGKNLITSTTFNSAEPLPELSEVNEELQIDLAGPMFDSKGKKLLIIVAIDRFSKYPSALITRKSESEKNTQVLKKLHTPTYHTKEFKDRSIFGIQKCEGSRIL